LMASLTAAVAAGAYAVHLNTCAEQNASHPPGSSHEAGCSTCPADCGWCCRAFWLFGVLEGLQQGVGDVAERTPAWVAAFVEAAKREGLTQQQYLQQQLLAVAWRRPVPYVCGNVLCERLEGPSAVGAVRGPKGTLCGGCKAAWYCCEGCQRAAWDAHRAVCRGCPCKADK
jgi:hypothetical protein